MLEVGTLDYFKDTSSWWDSRNIKQAVSDEYTKFISELANWKNFWTLTFRDEQAVDVARAKFKWLVRSLNQNLLGKNYTNKVGHSYFSYVVGMEKQTRDVIHFHALTDQPVNYDLIHALWGDRCGFAYIDGNLRDRSKVVNYVCKYVLKGGEVEPFKRTREFWVQNPAPWWWRSD